MTVRDNPQHLQGLPHATTRKIKALHHSKRLVIQLPACACIMRGRVEQRLRKERGKIQRGCAPKPQHVVRQASVRWPEVHVPVPLPCTPCATSG